MKKNKKILAIIPARGGSKGIPKKNIKLFNGNPLISYTIEYANSCSMVDSTVVSTDDGEIEKIASEYNAEIIKRPKAISGDHATTESAIEHVLDTLINKPDIIILLQATSPLRPDNSLENALNTFYNGKYDSLLSISPTHRFFWKISNNIAIPKYDFKNRPHRQDIKYKDIEYVENGSVYIFSYQHFMKTKNRLGGKMGYVIFPEEFSLEIDTTLDFTILENYAKLSKT
jgi:N-acylneuraminate cytidylyltransferase